jgi:hypothetical protein
MPTTASTSSGEVTPRAAAAEISKEVEEVEEVAAVLSAG